MHARLAAAARRACPPAVCACAQTRAEPVLGMACYTNHSCYGDGAVLDVNGDGGDREAYGVGATADSFHYWTAAELGANPAGTASPSQLSYRNFPSGGAHTTRRRATRCESGRCESLVDTRERKAPRAAVPRWPHSSA